MKGLVIPGVEVGVGIPAWGVEGGVERGSRAVVALVI
jgi:hypothetical protein